MLLIKRSLWPASVRRPCSAAVQTQSPVHWTDWDEVIYLRAPPQLRPSGEQVISQSTVWALFHWIDWDRVVCTAWAKERHTVDRRTGDERQSGRKREGIWRQKERESDGEVEKMNLEAFLGRCGAELCLKSPVISPEKWRAGNFKEFWWHFQLLGVLSLLRVSGPRVHLEILACHQNKRLKSPSRQLTVTDSRQLHVPETLNLSSGY